MAVYDIKNSWGRGGGWRGSWLLNGFTPCACASVMHLIGRWHSWMRDVWPWLMNLLGFCWEKLTKLLGRLQRGQKEAKAADRSVANYHHLPGHWPCWLTWMSPWLSTEMVSYGLWYSPPSAPELELHWIGWAYIVCLSPDNKGSLYKVEVACSWSTPEDSYWDIVPLANLVVWWRILCMQWWSV